MTNLARALGVLGLWFGIASAPAAAQGPAAPASLAAHRVTEAIRIDGRLDEAAWRDAEPAGHFVQEAPHHGEGATSPTEVRVLYDDQSLYVGARMHHPAAAGRVTGLVHRRDRDSASDWFGVAVDSVHDRRTAHEFRVNAAGVQRDVLLFADTSSDDTWDAVWDSAVSIDGDGWIAELRIPLALLRIRAGDGDQSWGINFVRVDQDPQETDRWHVVARSENAFVSGFPSLVGLSGLRPQGRREIIPYVTVDGKLATAQAFDDRGLDARAGVDAHLGLGSSSLLDLTFLPDFGQTEVDQVILNLSTIETLFPEKRTFFLEGSELFAVNGTQLFYSRRIGGPAPPLVLAGGETLVDRPPAALDILGAAKFTGKYESGLDLGVLAAETEPAYARVRAADGSVVTRQLAPRTDAGVVRVLQQIGSHGSYVGAFSSLLVERDGGRRAYVGAADATWKSDDGSAQVDALGGGSVQGGDRGTGATGNARAIKRWDAGWYALASGDFATRRFDPNDLGYIVSPDHILLNGEAGRQWDRTLGVFRNWSAVVAWGYGREHSGRAFLDNPSLKLTTGFTSDWTAYTVAGVLLPFYDDRELRTFDDPEKKYLHHGNEPYLGVGVASSRQRAWFAQLDLSVSYYARPTYTATLSQTVHPSSRIELQSLTDYYDAHGEIHWLETQGDTPIVGSRRLRQLTQTVRASYAFTPSLTLQAYVQLLLASWHYSDLASYVDNDTLAPGAMAETTDFTANTFNVNGVLRWELGPGSTLYAVYTRGAFNSDVFHHDASISRRTLPDLVGGPSDDVLQVKLSWMFR